VRGAGRAGDRGTLGVAPAPVCSTSFLRPAPSVRLSLSSLAGGQPVAPLADRAPFNRLPSGRSSSRLGRSTRGLHALPGIGCCTRVYLPRRRERPRLTTAASSAPRTRRNGPGARARNKDRHLPCTGSAKGCFDARSDAQIGYATGTLGDARSTYTAMIDRVRAIPDNGLQLTGGP